MLFELLLVHMENQTITKTKIDTNIGTFEFEGSQEFVEKQIEKILEIAKNSPKIVPQTQDITPNMEINQNQKRTTNRKSLIEQPQMLPNLISESSKINDLKSFFVSKSPINQMEKFAVLAYWLKNNDGPTEVSINEMWTMYKILTMKPPQVLIQVFRDAKSKKAYFEASTKKGYYYLAPLGETIVEHELPHKAVSK